VPGGRERRPREIEDQQHEGDPTDQERATEAPTGPRRRAAGPCLHPARRYPGGGRWDCFRRTTHGLENLPRAHRTGKGMASSAELAVLWWGRVGWSVA
jgi:hypothetical protein